MALLVGLYNPHSKKPEDDLGPLPANSSGYRLCKMFREANPGRTTLDYVRGFNRTNLIRDPKGDPAVGARAILDVLPPWTEVVLCGHIVLHAFNHYLVPKAKPILYNRQAIGNLYFYFIHHPSGLTRSYNDPAMQRNVGRLLGQLMYKESE